MIDGLIDGIMETLGTILYPLFSVIFLFIDMLQAIFKTFAGTGTIGFKGAPGNSIGAGNTGEEADSGILYYLFQQDIIKNMILSIFYLAIVLLLVFTVMKFIQNIYSEKPKKWQDILSSAIKGLANFVFLPVCCILGVWVSNILLNAIEGATASANTTTQLSRQLFISAAYDANYIRSEQKIITADDAKAIQEFCNNNGYREVNVIVPTDPQGSSDYEYYAQIIDECFAKGSPNIHSYKTVHGYYNLININYVILVGGGLFMAYVLGSIAFAMVKRLFYLIILFVISPIPCAMYPLNDGSAVNTWKGVFIQNTISAYGAVAGMNLFFSIMPIIQKIDMKTGTWGGAVMNYSGLLTLVLTIAGLFVVKDVISFISSLIGADNAYTSGSGLMGNVSKKMKSGMAKTTKGVAGVTGAFAKAKSAAETGQRGGYFGSLVMSALKGNNYDNKDAKPSGGIAGGLRALGKTTGLDIDGITGSYRNNYNEKGTTKARDYRKNMLDGEMIEKDKNTGHENERFYRDASGNKIYESDAGFSAAEFRKQRQNKLEVWQKNGGKIDESDSVGKEYLKSIGLTSVQYNKEKESFDTLESDKKALDKNVDKYQRLVSEWDGLSESNAESFFGIGKENLGTATMVQEWLKDFVDDHGNFQHGKYAKAVQAGQVQIDADQLDVDKLMKNYGLSRQEAQDVAKFNKRTADVNTARQEVKSAGEVVIEHANDMKDNKAFKIDDTSMTNLANSISEAMSSNSVTSKNAMDNMTEILADLKDKTTGEVLKKVNSGLKEIVKEIKKSNASGGDKK